MIEITRDIRLSSNDVKITFIRSPGPGGQHVNKVATAVQLRFALFETAALPEPVKQRLILLVASKLTASGELIIKASRYRTQERNKQDAIERLVELIRQAMIIPRKRKKTRPTYASRVKRLDTKKIHARTKLLRGKKSVRDD